MDEYRLNFVIPRGKDGKSSISAIAIIGFNNTSTAGNLQIQGTTIVPSNTQVFSIQNNQITVKELGFYEFTISGLLRKNVDSEIGILTVISEENGTQENLIKIELQNTNEIYFSQEKIINILSKKNIFLTLQASSTNISVQNINLILKKLSN